MTREEILNMPAGRDMDKLISIHLFSMEWDGGNPIFGYCGRWPWPVPFSADIAAAWEVFVKLLDIDPSADIGRSNHPHGMWAVGLNQDEMGPNDLVFGETAPLVICRAALLMVLEEEK